MLLSLVNELKENDTLYIFIDGKENETKTKLMIDEIINLFICEVVITVEESPLGYWGHGLRNKYQSKLKGDYIMHADDDDSYIEGSFDKIRKKINDSINGDVIYFYKFYTNHTHSDFVWRIPTIEFGNIGTPSGVIPNKPENFGEWKYRHGGDFDFYNSCRFKHQEFVNEIIYIVKP